MQPLEEQAKDTVSTFTNLYECHAPSLLVYIRRYLPSDEDAEGILRKASDGTLIKEYQLGSGAFFLPEVVVAP